MNAAQKAWATRRARLAAGVATVMAVSAAAPVVNRSWEQPVAQGRAATPQEVRATAPVTECELVEISIDEATVGSGRRLFVVLEMGERMVRLFSPARLVTVAVERKYFEKYAIDARRGVKRSRVAEIIRRNRALADRVNEAEQRTASEMLADGGADAVRALELLGA